MYYITVLRIRNDDTESWFGINTSAPTIMKVKWCQNADLPERDPNKAKMNSKHDVNISCSWKFMIWRKWSLHLISVTSEPQQFSLIILHLFTFWYITSSQGSNKDNVNQLLISILYWGRELVCKKTSGDNANILNLRGEALTSNVPDYKQMEITSKQSGDTEHTRQGKW